MYDNASGDEHDVHAAINISSQSSSTAVLFLHGFTGSPAVFADVAREVASRADVSVSVPKLAGHGTTWQDMSRTRWQDWLADAERALMGCADEHDTVIVVGLSMGGALALTLAADHPDLVDRLVLINPALYVDSPLAPLTPILRHVIKSVPGIGGDIALPGAAEHAYTQTPVAAVASLHQELKHLRRRLWQVSAPTTLCISTTDHVVRPRSARLLRNALLTSPRVVILRRSYHVATVDYDADVIVGEIVSTVNTASSVRTS
ncbi:alpha/beta hydrolase [Brevibacterium luteolum]|uniref:alpha/beta hydrolase n=1 Tax=Brevibacterium luteolum TaxID=199591 RepID=UPI003EEF9F08